MPQLIHRVSTPPCTGKNQMLKKYSHAITFFLRTRLIRALLISLITLITLLSLLSHSSRLAHAQAPLPVLVGENKNASGEQQALPPFILQLFSQLEGELGQAFSIERYPWVRAIKLAETEKKLIFGFSFTTERAKQFRFSEPLYYNNIWLVTRSDRTFPFKTLSDLKGKSVGVLRGSNYGGEFDRQKNKLFRVEDDVDAYPARLKKLLMKRMDAMLYASAESRPQMVEAQINKIVIDDADVPSSEHPRFSVLAVPVLRDGVRFAINNDDQSDIITRLDRAIERVRRSGAINRIMATPGLP